jgi:hypothetical protein
VIATGLGSPQWIVVMGHGRTENGHRIVADVFVVTFDSHQSALAGCALFTNCAWPHPACP